MIKKTVQKLIQEHQTNDPYEIAKGIENLYVYEWPLHPDVKGFYQNDPPYRLIYINCSLPHYLKRAVCAHELGHAFLHPTINSLTIRGYTFFSKDKFEHQANLFAVELLLCDNIWSRYPTFTLAQIAAAEQVPLEFVELKRQHTDKLNL